MSLLVQRLARASCLAAAAAAAAATAAAAVDGAATMARPALRALALLCAITVATAAPTQLSSSAMIFRGADFEPEWLDGVTQPRCWHLVDRCVRPSF